MGLSRGSSIALILATFILVAYYTSTSSSSSSSSIVNMATSRAASGPIAGLDLSLEQKATAPPTITVTVKNNNDHPVTVLRYGSPLDALALQLGLLSVTPAGADAPLEIPVVQVRRMWPPKPDMLVTIAPGETATSDIVLKKPAVSPENLGGKASVVLKGQWDAVWSKVKEDISSESLKNIKDNDEVASGDYESKSLDITVE